MRALRATRRRGRSSSTSRRRRSGRSTPSSTAPPTTPSTPLPPELAGAGWIATRRQSKPDAKAPLSFTAGAAAEVFVIGSEASALDQALRRAGFEATDRRGLWRDDTLALVPYRLFRRAVAAGDKVAIPAVTADYVVLVKKR